MLGTILLVVLVLMLLGSLPRWPHSRNWGYYPSGGIGTLLVVGLWMKFFPPLRRVNKFTDVMIPL